MIPPPEQTTNQPAFATAEVSEDCVTHDRSLWLTDAAICFAIALMTLIPYVQTFSFEFVNFDDPGYVYENALLKNGLTLASVSEATVGFHEANWHPLVWLSYMLEVELFGMSPGPMHITNVVLHILNSLMLYLWLRMATGSMVRSFLVALVFAIHPAHVESVAWITERKDVLSTLFLFGTLTGYTRYCQTGKRVWYIGSVIAFAIGLTAKGMLVTVPVVLLLNDAWPLNRIRLADSAAKLSGSLLRRLPEKIPFILLSAAVSVITITAQKSAGAVSDLQALSISDRLANSAVSCVRYSVMTIWPFGLSVFYPMPDGGWPVASVAMAVVFLVTVTSVSVLLRKKHPAVLVGWLWFLITLLPVIGLIQVGSQSMADRYMYVPMVGLSMAAIWSMPKRWFTASPVSIASFATLVLFLCVLTGLQAGVWENSIRLFENALAAKPENNFVSRANLGLAYSDAGRLEEAAVQLALAHRLRPSHVGTLLNIARNCNRLKQFEQAEQVLNAAMKINNNDAGVWLHLGNAMRGLNRIDSSMHCYQRAAEINPNSSEALNNLGILVGRSNKARGIELIKRAIEANPMNPDPYNSLGNAMVTTGEYASAEECYLEAIRLGNLPVAVENLEYVRSLRKGTPQKKD